MMDEKRKQEILDELEQVVVERAKLIEGAYRLMEKWGSEIHKGAARPVAKVHIGDLKELLNRAKEREP